MTEQELYDDYITNIAAYCNGTTLHGNPSDERLMRKVENALGVPEQAAWDFRTMMLRKIAAGTILNGSYDWKEDKDLLYTFQQIVGGW